MKRVPTNLLEPNAIKVLVLRACHDFSCFEKRSSLFGKHIRKTRTQVDLYALDCIQNDKPKLSVEGIEGPNLVEGSSCLETVVILETEYMPVAGEPIISNISQMRNQRCSVSIHSALLYEEISLLIKCEERLLVFQGINSSIARYGKTRQCASLRGRAGLLPVAYHIYQPLNQDSVSYLWPVALKPLCTLFPMPVAGGISSPSAEPEHLDSGCRLMVSSSMRHTG